MLEPVGPLNSKVYWIRRAAVVAVALVVVLLLVWIMSGRGGADTSNTSSSTPTTLAPLTGVLATGSSSSASTGTDLTESMFPGAASSASAANTTGTDASATAGTDAAATDPAAQQTVSEVATTVVSPGADPAAESAAAQAAAEAAAAQAAADQAAAQAAAEAAAAQAAAQAAADAAAAQAAADAARPRDAEGRLICPDTSMKLTATVGAPEYNVGQQPIVGVTVQNIGTEACVRDLSGGLQDYLAYDAAGTRIWSTNDCLPGTGTDIRLMNPGDSLQYNIKWSARTSQPGCAGERTTVPAGTYTMEVRIGSLVSSQTPLTFK